MTESEEEKMEYLEIIQKNSNLLLQIINDILDLSRIESGKSEMHFQQVEIAGLVEEVEKVHHTVTISRSPVFSFGTNHFQFYIRLHLQLVHFFHFFH